MKQLIPAAIPNQNFIPNPYVIVHVVSSNNVFLNYDVYKETSVPLLACKHFVCSSCLYTLHHRI